MASLNVEEWTPDQVSDWLEGLGGAAAAQARAWGLCGARLLALRGDQLEALGLRAIGHQELVLEALEHLRNFQYEVRRECVQQLALRVSVLAESLARALRHHHDTRLDTQSLADVARTVGAVKPLASWLAGAGGAGGELAARGAALLALALEAATCAQRDRFAEQPARAVAASAAAAAATADYIIQQASDPCVLQPCVLAAVTLRVGARAPGFAVRAAYGGRAQLAAVRFGSPAHASGLVQPGDEIVQVGGQCVVGWSGEAVLRACRDSAARSGELALRLRRRAAPAPRRARPRPRARLHNLQMTPPPSLLCEPLSEEPSAADEPVTPNDVAAPPEPRGERRASPASSDSEPLSPPASPTQLHPDHTRMYPPKPRAAARRRHSVSGGSPVRARNALPIDQFWQELRSRRWRGAGAGAEAGAVALDDAALYRRDKALSCSTGLEARPAPLPRALLLQLHARPPPLLPAPAPPATTPPHRATLDKAHSTPAYDFASSLDEPSGAGGAFAVEPIPESPDAPSDAASDGPSHAPSAAPPDTPAEDDQSSDRSSYNLDSPVLLRRAPAGPRAPAAPLDTLNVALLERLERARGGEADSPGGAGGAGLVGGAPPAAPSPPPRPPGSVAPRAAEYPALRAVRAQPLRQEYSVLKPVRGALGAAHISAPLRTLSPHPLRALTPPPTCAAPPAPADAPAHTSPATSPQLDMPSPGAGACGTGGDAGAGAGGGVRGMFPTSKSRSLKKKSSLLAKRRLVPAAAAAACARGAAGSVWQRVRARHAAQPRWAPRHLVLAHNVLLAYRSPESARADCMVRLEGFTASAAGEVRSRAHAFKVYHTGRAFYFACAGRDALLAWLQLLQRATLLPGLLPPATDISQQYSETDYSSGSDGENGERRAERERERDAPKEKEKDKSKFGSLKKLTGRVARSESQESVAGAAGGAGGGAAGGGASLDRKYLRFFSRRAKDDKRAKSKQSGVPVPTEHYRSYRRVPPSPSLSPSTPTTPVSPSTPPEDSTRASKRIPKPINYIHASNPNLLDFEQSAWARPGAGAGGPGGGAGRRRRELDSFVGSVTLEEFMLKKQEEERRQVYTNRVLMGIERTRAEGRGVGEEAAGAGGAGGAGGGTRRAARDLQERLQRIVPDVIYGELPAPEEAGPPARRLPAAPAEPTARASPRLGKPISVTGKDGYEKLVYPEELEAAGAGAGGGAGSPRAAPRRSPPPAPAPGPERWRDSLRRNDKVHSGAPLKSAAQYTPLPLPAAAPLHLLAADSWATVGAGDAASGAGGGAGGVSRLRLMFGARSASRDAPQQEKPPSSGTFSAPATVGRAAPAPAPHYPHLQCPPTFQPETYSLARPPHPPPQPPQP